MKRLYLLRHGKSDYPLNVKDIQRPLNPRGFFDCKLIGEMLKQRNIMPDIIYSPPALRCGQSILEIVKIIGYPKEKIIFEDILYKLHEVNNLKQIDFMINFIRDLSENVSEVMIVGHNDGIKYLVKYLTGKKIKFYTCGFMYIELDIKKWKNVKKKCGKIGFYDYPDKFKNFEEL